MVRRRGTIPVAKHKTAMERGYEPCRTRFHGVDENMLETKPDRLVSRKVEELSDAMPDASGRRDHRGREIRACVRSEGLPCGPLRAEPDREGRDDDARGAEAEGRGLRVGGDSDATGVAGRASRRRRSTCTWPASARAGSTTPAACCGASGCPPRRSPTSPGACTRTSINGGTVPWRPIRTRTCSWTACGDRRTWGGSVENVSVLVDIGVDDTGHREVVGVAEGMKEDKASRGSSSGA